MTQPKEGVIKVRDGVLPEGACGSWSIHRSALRASGLGCSSAHAYLWLHEVHFQF